MKTTIIILFLTAALHACTAQQAYEGLRAGQRNECLKYDEPERTRCLEAADAPYETYEQSRTARPTPFP